MLFTRFRARDEIEKRLAVKTLWEAFPCHEPALLKHSVRKEESVGGDQFDDRMVWPTRQKRLKNTRDSRLANGNRPRHPNDERHRTGWRTQEGVCDRRQLLASLDMKIEQPGQREESVLDHIDVELDIDTTELLDVLFGEGQRRARPQLRPSLAIKIDVMGLRHHQPGYRRTEPNPDLRYSNAMTDQQFPKDSGQYPEASQATTVLVLGILGLIICGVLAPVAWIMGKNELEAIDSGRRPPENRGTANAGRILGIIGTVLIGIGLAFLVLILVGAFAFNF